MSFDLAHGALFGLAIHLAIGSAAPLAFRALVLRYLQSRRIL